MKQMLLLLVALLLAGLMAVPGAAAQSAEETVVQAVLFYSPTCPHCHEVIEKLIIPMVEQYGKRLQVMGVNVSEEGGQALYQSAIEHFDIPPTRLGVPTLVVDDVVLVGSGEIPAQFPKIVEAGLSAEGIGWPAIPGLMAAIPVEPEPAAQSGQEPAAPSQTETAVESKAEAPVEAPESPAPAETDASLPASTNGKAAAQPDPQNSIATIDQENVPAVEVANPPADPVGLSLAGLVLVGMLAALGYAGRNIVFMRQQLLRLSRHSVGYAKSWAVPVFSLIGLAIAGYLAYVEINQMEAICGPVGQCNVVQSSPYARIAGVPIAVLGLLNYVALLLLWLGYRYSHGTAADLSLLGLLGLTVSSTIFSMYLTLVEIYVIQAVCLWCISSAIVTTVLLLFTAASIRRMPVGQAIAA